MKKAPWDSSVRFDMKSTAFVVWPGVYCSVMCPSRLSHHSRPEWRLRETSSPLMGEDQGEGVWLIYPWFGRKMPNELVYPCRNVVSPTWPISPLQKKPVSGIALTFSLNMSVS